MLIVVQFLLSFLMLLAVFMGSEQRLLPDLVLWRVLGFVLLVASAGLALAAFWSLGRSFRVAPAPKQEATLVTSGIYGRLRHPMYTAGGQLAAGAFLLRAPVSPVFPLLCGLGQLLALGSTRIAILANLRWLRRRLGHAPISAKSTEWP